MVLRNWLLLRVIQSGREFGTGIALGRDTNTMKTPNTYSLLTNSQEKGRNLLEFAVYGLVWLCMAYSAWEFISSPVVIPGLGRTTPSVAAPIEEPAQHSTFVASN